MTNQLIIRDSLDTYIAEINRFPLLTRTEEQAYAFDFYENNNLQAAQKLVQANLRYVVKVAFEFQNYGLNIKDLIQEGNMGLMNAVKKFNPHKGVRLITYATWWIKHCIQEFIIKSKGIVKQNAKALKKKLFYKDHNEDTTISASALSLDETVSKDGDGDTTHLDMLECDNLCQETSLAIKQETSIVEAKVFEALKTLTPKEQIVIKERFMGSDGKSLQAIGDELNISRERVRQIEANALKKLKNNDTMASLALN